MVKTRLNKKALNMSNFEMQIAKAQESTKKWDDSVKKLIQKKIIEIINSNKIPAHIVHVRVEPGIWKGLHTVQVEAISKNNTLFKEAGYGTSTEKSASLVYSPSYNGSVVVIVYPHKSEASEPLYKEDDYYIIDLVSTSDFFTGIEGCARIRKHLNIFSDTCGYTHFEYMPDRKSEHLINKLIKSHNKFRSMYSSYNEKRQAELNANMALGAGLVAGLIASSIFPLGLAYGDHETALVKEIIERCSAAKDVQRCWDSSLYSFHNFLSSVLSVEGLIITAAVLSVAALWLMRQMLKK